MLLKTQLWMFVISVHLILGLVMPECVLSVSVCLGWPCETTELVCDYNSPPVWHSCSVCNVVVFSAVVFVLCADPNLCGDCCPLTFLANNGCICVLSLAHCMMWCCLNLRLNAATLPTGGRQQNKWKHQYKIFRKLSVKYGKRVNTDKISKNIPVN